VLDQEESGVTDARIISVANAPDIPGLLFRHFRGDEDFPQMAAVAGASETFDEEEYIHTAESVSRNYDCNYTFDRHQDVIMAEIAGQLVAYARCGWESELGDNTRIYYSLGFMLPEWRRRGIGRALLVWLEARLRRIATSHPAQPKKLIQVVHADRQHAKAALFAAFGYVPVRLGQTMLRPTLDDVPNHPLPHGLELRPVRPEHYRALWDAANEAMRDHWGMEELDDRDYQNWLNDPFVFQPQNWQVAWDIANNQIAGQVRTFILLEENEKYGRRRGYTEFITVRKPWRRQGLARALISRSLQLQRAKGMTESALGADSENIAGAIRIYVEMGFRVTKTYTTMRKPL
jgi:mycothiol synthase